MMKRKLEEPAIVEPDCDDRMSPHSPKRLAKEICDREPAEDVAITLLSMKGPINSPSKSSSSTPSLTVIEYHSDDDVESTSKAPEPTRVSLKPTYPRVRATPWAATAAPESTNALSFALSCPPRLPSVAARTRAPVDARKKTMALPQGRPLRACPRFPKAVDSSSLGELCMKL